MKDKRNAIAWAVGWWLVRRRLRKRADDAIAGVTGVATAPRRGRDIVGALLLVGLLVGALVAWKRLSAGGDDWDQPPEPEPEPVPHTPVAA